jgi:hypothetical protein
MRLDIPPETTEEYGKDGCRGKRLKDGPSRSEERLAVAHLDVSQSQQEKKVAILPERGQTQVEAGRFRRNVDRHRACRG